MQAGQRRVDTLYKDGNIANRNVVVGDMRGNDVSGQINQ
jgi:hypothetical protein